jgi:Xaa-Pro aminopeptidase
VKSAAEIELLRLAGRRAEAGLAAARAALRPGVTEVALAAAVEGAVRAAGSDYWAIPVELTSGPRSAGCHGTPRERTIELGEIVHLEFAGVAARYHAVAIQTLACGTPSARAAEVYEIARQSLVAGIAAVGPGVPVGAVEEASLGPVRAAGFEHAAMMRFGYGVGIAYPPIWLETLQIDRAFARPLEPGMVFVLHACLELPDEALGVILGGTYALTDTGLECLAGAGDVPLDQVSAQSAR